MTRLMYFSLFSRLQALPPPFFKVYSFILRETERERVQVREAETEGDRGSEAGSVLRRPDEGLELTSPRS